MFASIQPYETTIILAAGVVALIALILAVSGLIGQRILKRRFKKWRTIHATADLEAVYAQTLEAVEELRSEFETLQSEVQRMRKQLRHKVSTPQVMRYNAFAEQGSDLSFSIALVDDEENGVVISSIYGREESRTYAKPIKGAVSTYPLTAEEQAVLSHVAVTEERSND
ncbi:DUF4446 family protein [Alicyclobacillus cycloheptanicus]|jgi:hypothetical protein|uniref:DUF4446 family protein n=1 Tax=Alicyclobacillus cycloheptanicus TaxID=1457 RepID=A0ABT9XKV9_9BACL|nr:DUF4446 family protein [Alicyclobacillus cycloheptanicus]MDQ0190941.1 hypothetical protein [Alicyclobacillus cycloheptanicus]WDM02389.1 DUF4446 family protein [Alicyclobacillus cycloheptanicus]